MRRAALVLVTAVLCGRHGWSTGARGRGRQGAADPTLPGGRGRGVQIQPGDECPAGTTLVRVGVCQAPEFPPPSIVDYRPKSTLVVEQHPVPRARFPVVDIHSHVMPTPQTIDQLVEGDGRAEPARAGHREQHVRRPAAAAARDDHARVPTRIGSA